jgi:hypothetical protein
LKTRRACAQFGLSFGFGEIRQSLLRLCSLLLEEISKSLANQFAEVVPEGFTELITAAGIFIFCVVGDVFLCVVIVIKVIVIVEFRLIS